MLTKCDDNIEIFNDFHISESRLTARSECDKVILQIHVKATIGPNRLAARAKLAPGLDPQPSQQSESKEAAGPQRNYQATSCPLSLRVPGRPENSFPEKQTMWRRLSPQLQTLAALSWRSAVPRSGGANSLTRQRPLLSASSLFSTDSDADLSKPKKRVEDVMPIATGLEREEIEGELEGNKRFDMDAPVGPFGTKEIALVANLLVMTPKFVSDHRYEYRYRGLYNSRNVPKLLCTSNLQLNRDFGGCTNLRSNSDPDLDSCYGLPAGHSTGWLLAIEVSSSSKAGFACEYLQCLLQELPLHSSALEGFELHGLILLYPLKDSDLQKLRAPSFFEILNSARRLQVKSPILPLAWLFYLQEAPAVIKSYYDKRIVGCPGGEGEDEHDVVWFWLEKGKPHECPVCSQFQFIEAKVVPVRLEVIGEGGPPDGHGDDDH
ncbi:hypothetical protein ACLOJK_021304 [Asimina triloba]